MARRVSDEAVKRATGKDWKQWFAVIDRLGGRKLAHMEIAEKLFDAYGPGLSGWWSQMVTVAYEQARGKRAKGQRAEGTYSISKSATIDAPMKAIFDAWNDPSQRTRFAKGIRFGLRSVRPPDVVRLNLPEDGSYIEVRISSKGTARCSVVVQHEKIPDAKTAEKRKKEWAGNLEALKRTLEG